MKKFFIVLLILIALGGAAFFVGWVQFAVPPGQFGVVSSKTHGIDPLVVKSGEFRWIWYKLIPTNVRIAVFSLEHSKYTIDFNSALPSGDTYASFIGAANANFSWNLRGEITFIINPEKLVVITEKNNLENQDDLEKYSESIAKNIELIIINTLSSADSDRLEKIMAGNTDSGLKQEISEKFPEIKDFSFVIHSAKFPDFILYRQLRILYEDFISKQREYIASSFGTRAESHIESQFRFEELSKYGELLTKYPILLEYIELEHTISGN